MDFIAKNTRGAIPSTEQVNAEIKEDLASVEAEHNKPIQTNPEDVVPNLVEKPTEEKPTDIPEGESQGEEGESSSEEPTEEPTEEPVSPEEEEEEGVSLKGDAAENFKKLRTKFKEVRTEKEALEKTLKEHTKELEGYRRGEKIPEELEKREARIAELEEKEKVLDLRTSRYYQEKFVKPLEGIKQQLTKIAKDYGVDPNLLGQAANLQSEAELNRFLSNNFDPVGATEIKSIIKSYHRLQQEAVEAEKEPKMALNKMMENAKSAEQQQRVARMEAMQDTSRQAWKDALKKIKQEGKVRELIFKEGDSQHNQVVTPIVQAAAREYGKLVTELVKSGLESLPLPLAETLSRMCQLAHASAVAIDSRERAVAMMEEIEASSYRTNRYARPSMAGKPGTGKPYSNGKGAFGGPSSTEEASEALINSIHRG